MHNNKNKNKMKTTEKATTIYSSDMIETPSENQKQIYNDHIKYKSIFFCYLKDDSVVYKCTDGYVKIKSK